MSDHTNVKLGSPLKTVLQKAALRCQQQGGKLTEKRERVLAQLVRSNTPLSAYEVADLMNKESEQNMPAMSVYRILDFLVSNQLVHKLSSANKYLACSHIACEHKHAVPQFLICRNCHAVKEIGISRKILEELKASVSKAGYHLQNSQLELDCLCENCLSQ